MYNCTLILCNMSEWIEYAKNILAYTNHITDEVILKILSFPFEFGSLNTDT